MLCRKAKEQWMEKNSKEIELMMNRHNNRVNAKVKNYSLIPKQEATLSRIKKV
jgi:hypothetical protein